jgi:predicted dehydrogenase
MSPNQEVGLEVLRRLSSSDNDKIKVAILGCGMMGQEHISFISGYSTLQIDFLCDPYKPSLDKALQVMERFNNIAPQPMLLTDESDLLTFADAIDLLVIASPNYLHTDSLTKWGEYDLCILCEKPVAVSQEQHDALLKLSLEPTFVARIWVAMEYRYIPAIAKLLHLIPLIGDLKMVTIRENRFPFLQKIGSWNRDASKTGDTLVEKCCHFFDLFRLITGMEISKVGIRSIAQRGINYSDELQQSEHPIMDAAYVIFPFVREHGGLNEPTPDQSYKTTIGCLELCMYADGSRHQEEIIVTGTKGRLEAYLPENKVYCYQRPSSEHWKDKREPPPLEAIKETVYDCSDIKDTHNIDNDMPTHAGYHYGSTAVEWYRLIAALKKYQATGTWKPDVSLNDGLRAVEIGLSSTRALERDE